MVCCKVPVLILSAMWGQWKQDLKHTLTCYIHYTLCFAFVLCCSVCTYVWLILYTCLTLLENSYLNTSSTFVSPLFGFDRQQILVEISDSKAPLCSPAAVWCWAGNIQSGVTQSAEARKLHWGFMRSEPQFNTFATNSHLSLFLFPVISLLSTLK